MDVDFPKDGQEISRNLEALKSRLRARGGRRGVKGGRQVSMDWGGGHESQSNSEYAFYTIPSMIIPLIRERNHKLRSADKAQDQS